MRLTTFFRRYMVPYTPWYAGGVLALLGTNWISTTIPLYVANGIDAIGTDRGPEVLTKTALSVGALGLIVILVRSASRVLFFTPGRYVESQLKHDLFAAVLRHQPSFLQNFATGDLFSRISSDVNMLRLLGGFGVLQLTNVIIALSLAGTQMYRLSPELATVAIIPLTVGLVLMQLFIRRLFKLLKRLQIQLASLSDFTLSSYQGVATIQGFAATEAFEERFDGYNRDYLRTLLDRSQIRAFMAPTLALTAAINTFLLLYLGGPMVIEGALTVGELVAFIALLNFATMPLRASSFLVSVIKQAQASLERVGVLLETPPERPELPSPAPFPSRPPALTVQNLTFTYPGADAPTLHDLSIELGGGQTLGVLGLTGSGKTTLLHVLMRLYNPPEGTVFFDGEDATGLDLDDLRKHATLVPQRAFLFSESLAENIQMGVHDEQTLETAIQRAALAPDLRGLPEGLETEVGESGVRLSGGQRQRTALARGLARSSEMLLLDDVLSAVDHATEAQLIDTLRKGSDGVRPTTIIVAHRVSALMHADKVLVLDQGRASDFGSPRELLSREGLFRETWEQQQALEES